ncbi:MAG: hypothetical protein ACTHU0_14490 [Kofleriaceae bacterium]
MTRLVPHTIYLVTVLGDDATRPASLDEMRAALRAPYDGIINVEGVDVYLARSIIRAEGEFVEPLSDEEIAQLIALVEGDHS